MPSYVINILSGDHMCFTLFMRYLKFNVDPFIDYPHNLKYDVYDTCVGTLPNIFRNPHVS